MKKALAIILALAMVLSISVFATSAASGKFEETVGSITINKYNENNVYSIFRMLDLQSFDTTGEGSYAYVVNSSWTAFFTEGGAGAAYVTIKDGYVSWNTNVSDTLAAEFAEKALKFAKDNDIDPIASSSNPSAGIFDETGEFPTFKFTDLSLGYYLVDSTMGALCGLTTTNPDASINAKNGEPTLNLHVQENSTTLWGLENSANIGDTINYRVTIFVQPGAENYRLHLELGDALINPARVSVVYGDQTVSADKYEVITTGFNDDCDMAIFFDADYCRTLEAGKNLYVYYSAKLNANAVIAGEGNEATAVLQFGDLEDVAHPHVTQEGVVKTYTYAFDLIKTDKQNSLLNGAYFSVYRTEDGEPIDLVQVSDGETYYFRPAMAGETPYARTEKVTEDDNLKGVLVPGGKLRFVGFDSGDYYFGEEIAPAGYNILTAKAKFTLGNANKDAIFNGNVYSSGSGFHITNQSGAMLPETGAMGTALFISFGTLAVIATGVLLVTKKRMSMIQE